MLTNTYRLILGGDYEAEIRTGCYFEVTIDQKFSTEIEYKMHINYV